MERKLHRRSDTGAEVFSRLTREGRAVQPEEAAQDREAAMLRCCLCVCQWEWGEKRLEKGRWEASLT